MQAPSISYVMIRIIPESILFILAGFILLNLKINKSKILKNGLILGVVVTLVKYLPLAYGIHTVLAMMIGGFILTKITKLPLAQPVMATCGIFVSLALSEAIYVFFAEKIFSISITTLTTPDTVGAITSVPSLLVFIGIVIIMNKVALKINYKSKVK